MIVYGTKIKSDIDFPLDISHEMEMQYEMGTFSDYHYHPYISVFGWEKE